MEERIRQALRPSFVVLRLLCAATLTAFFILLGYVFDALEYIGGAHSVGFQPLYEP